MVKIITDTTSCLEPAFASRFRIPVIPQIIHFGEETFYEGIQLDHAGFIERLKTAPELPKTAAPPPELFREQFELLVPLGEPIICIHPSAEVSGTVRAASVAAQDFPGADIRIIDTRLIASPLASLVHLAVDWAEAGLNADTIEKNIREMISRCRIYFLVATLDYLVKGGRIGGAAALLGSMLQIKPILTFIDGKVDQFERERTHKRAMNRLVEIVCESYPKGKSGYLTVMQGGVPDQGYQLAEELSSLLDIAEISVYDMPPAIITHGGPGIIGVGFFTSPNSSY